MSEERSQKLSPAMSLLGLAGYSGSSGYDGTEKAAAVEALVRYVSIIGKEGVGTLSVRWCAQDVVSTRLSCGGRRY